MYRRRERLRGLGHKRVILLGVVFALVIILGRTSALADAKVTVGGPFTLTAPDGAAVTDAKYHGKWLLVFFGYTFCPDTCPLTLSHVAEALDQLGAEAAKVQPIFITVDPERDTPAVMGKYVNAFDPRIVGLTGSPAQIAAVAQEYGVYSAKNRGAEANGQNYSVDHSTYVYLMDPEGKFVRGLAADTPGEAMADALREAMERSGRSGLQMRSDVP